MLMVVSPMYSYSTPRMPAPLQPQMRLLTSTPKSKSQDSSLKIDVSTIASSSRMVASTGSSMKYSHDVSRTFNVPLPVFSQLIENLLQKGDIIKEMAKFIEETAYHVLESALDNTTTGHSIKTTSETETTIGGYKCTVKTGTTRLDLESLSDTSTISGGYESTLETEATRFETGTTNHVLESTSGTETTIGESKPTVETITAHIGLETCQPLV